MGDVALHVCMTKNRHPGKTGYSARSLVLDVVEKSVANGPNHYLEEHHVAAIVPASTDAVAKTSMKIRKAAPEAAVGLDHSDKWSQSIQFPPRPLEVALLLPDRQVMFGKHAAKSARKGRQARLSSRWHVFSFSPVLRLRTGIVNMKRPGRCKEVVPGPKCIGRILVQCVHSCQEPFSTWEAELSCKEAMLRHR